MRTRIGVAVTAIVAFGLTVAVPSVVTLASGWRFNGHH